MYGSITFCYIVMNAQMSNYNQSINQSNIFDPNFEGVKKLTTESQEMPGDARGWRKFSGDGQI